MTNNISVDEDTLHAAGVAIHTIDSARRVGWAKAFDAIRRADSAERDLNMIRSDTDLFRKFAARAFGALVELVGTGPVNDLFDGDCDEIRKSFPDGPYKAGQNAARNIIARFDVSVANNRAKLAELDAAAQTITKEVKKTKGELNDLNDQVRRAEKNKVIDAIIDEFGFADRKEFWDHLRTYPPYKATKPTQSQAETA